MKIYTLVENEALNPDFRAANGLSLLIETGGKRLLFDLGPDATFLENAKRLGLAIEDVDYLVISHGHVDHGGALALFLERNEKARVFMRGEAFEPHYRKRLLSFIDVGIPLVESERIEFVAGPLDIAPGIRLVSGFSKRGFVPIANRKSYVRRGGGMRRDDFSHELLLLVEEGGRAFAFTGCSHSGITNMMDAALESTGRGSLDFVIGGMHLFHSRLRPLKFALDLKRLGARLNAYRDTRYYTGHCTLSEGYEALHRRLGDRIAPIRAGTTIVL
jgi:7,8-dihydropterin-6-yl-methyl-4-(beta-D-ribofuranosyl)aminobenzene 5'-phosphate synthase